MEQPAAKPPTTIQPPAEKKTKWFNLKSKNQRVESPSKEMNSVADAPSGSTASKAAHPNALANGSPTENPSELSQQVIQEKIAALGLNFFSEYFEGTTTSSTICLTCETTTGQEVKMIDLSVPIENADADGLDDTFIQVSGSLHLRHDLSK